MRLPSHAWYTRPCNAVSVDSLDAIITSQCGCAWSSAHPHVRSSRHLPDAGDYIMSAAHDVMTERSGN